MGPRSFLSGDDDRSLPRASSHRVWPRRRDGRFAAAGPRAIGRLATSMGRLVCSPGDALGRDQGKFEPARLRIVQVHGLYRDRGGEDAAADAEVDLLRSSGVRVERLIFDSRDIDSRPGIGPSMRTALNVTWSTEASRRLKSVLRRVQPDLVHFHNTFPMASPSVVQRASRMGYPVVMTLHNYRLGCLNAQLYRDGSPCLECVGRVPWRGVVHGCYRRSRSASLALASSVVTHRLLRTWSNHVDLFLVPSSFAARILQAIGLDGDRLMVKPNAVGWEVDRTQESQGYFVMLGRVVEDKGVADVANSWAAFSIDASLKVVGDGPMFDRLKGQFGGSRVEFLGALPRQDVVPVLSGARALVFASRLFEVQPMTILEAMASAVPVIAPSGGAAEDLVTHGRNGLLYQPGDWRALADHVRLLSGDRELAREMGLAGAARYEVEFAPDVVLDATLRAYQGAIARRRTRGGAG